MGDDRKALIRELNARFPQSTCAEDTGEQETLMNTATESAKSKTPLDLRGTPFQKEVWEALRKIPAGKTETYAGIAHKIGRPKAVRAVAAACAANPVALLVPCHRVIRTDGSLSGYRWGVERKKKLLKQEKKGS